jgi:site-specific DNA recombinase
MAGRAVLYLRQSTSHDESISLELQETACRSYCEQRGYRVVASEADPGISGGTFNRPGVARVMTMIEAKQADVIILWKWSRLSRRNVDWYAALDRVEKAGGRIESATEPIDLSTGIGEFSRDMLISFAAFERKRISETWKETQKRRISLGHPGDGLPRFGYMSENKGFTPDPVWGPVLTSLYTKYLAGETTYDLADYLNSLGATTRFGRPWAPNRVASMMDTGFAAGHINVNGQTSPGAHKALITDAVWRKYVQRRAAKSPARGAWTRRTHMLSGLLWCALCLEDNEPGIMYANGRPGYPPGTLWRCMKHPSNNAWTPSVTKLLIPFVTDLLAGEDAGYQAALQPKAAPNIAGLQRILLKIEKNLLATAKKNLDGFYDDQTYLTLRAELLDKQRLIGKQIAESQGPPPVDDRTVRTALAGWQEQTPEKARAALGLVLLGVLVRVNEKPKYHLVRLFPPVSGS